MCLQGLGVSECAKAHMWRPKNISVDLFFPFKCYMSWVSYFYSQAGSLSNFTHRVISVSSIVFLLIIQDRKLATTRSLNYTDKFESVPYFLTAG